MEKIAIRENKVLKLNNVLIREVSENELIDLEKIGYMMDSYIKSKGNASVGPIINYTKVEVNENGEPKVNIKIMVQLKSPIHSIESPYEQKNQLRIANCLFARFTEKEENLKFAYDKMHPVVIIIMIVILSLMLSICSQVGDLICSKFKRTYEIKDFSQAIPGHGGILDRFDSVLFASIVFLCFITICRIALPLLMV